MHSFILDLIGSHIYNLNFNGKGSSFIKAKNNFLVNFYKNISTYPIIVTHTEFLYNSNIFTYDYYIKGTAIKKTSIKNIIIHKKFSFTKGYRVYIKSTSLSS